MATPRSKTLSRTDLNAWRNAAIGRAFGRNLSIADIAHVFDLSQRQVRHLKVKWRATGDLTPAPIVGRPRSVSRIRAQRSFRNKVRTNPVRTAAQLSREAGVSRRTGGRVMTDLGLRSRARERRQKLTPRDKVKRKERAEGLLRRLRDGLGPRIFVDESKLELTPYLNSTKDRVIEAHPGDAGDAGINQRRRSQGLMVLGVFISDGRSWCHIFSERESVTGATFTAAMQQFFEWLRADGGIAPNSALFMDGAPAHTANATQEAMSHCMAEVGGELLRKSC